jgi:transposase
MDMWDPYIKSTRRHVPNADAKIAFDKFHVIKQLTHAVDLVRRKEHKALRAQGDTTLTRTKYYWLQAPRRMTAERRASFASLRNSSLKTARAWAIKELGTKLWHYRHAGWAHKAWMRWYGWAIRSQLEPVKTVARMVKRHLKGIINAIVHRVTNARSEGLNSAIQWLKYAARGYRNRDRFRAAIFFHLGGLDLYPSTLATIEPTR